MLIICCIVIVMPFNMPRATPRQTNIYSKFRHPRVVQLPMEMCTVCYVFVFIFESFLWCATCDLICSLNFNLKCLRIFKMDDFWKFLKRVKYVLSYYVRRCRLVYTLASLHRLMTLWPVAWNNHVKLYLHFMHVRHRLHLLAMLCAPGRWLEEASPICQTRAPQRVY